MAYYDTIRTRTALKNASSGKLDFNSLTQAKGLRGASHWGPDHLFALGVVCVNPKDKLPILASHFPPRDVPLDPCIEALIKGPAAAGQTFTSALLGKPEPEIVSLYKPDSLGYVWAAFSKLQHVEDTDTTETGQQPQGRPEPMAESGELPPRSRRPPKSYGNMVSSEDMELDGDSQSQSSSSSDPSSLGYVGKPTGHYLEDLTVRLASSFIRCVLNYAQEPKTPVLEFRDAKNTYNYELARDGSATANKIVTAVDDGGIQLYLPGGSTSVVALLEAKRTLRFVEEGTPTVSDEVLAQMTGEAVALALGQGKIERVLPQEGVIIIHPIRHYVKFFHFNINLSHEKNLGPQPVADVTPLLVDSTSSWFDLKTVDGRRAVVMHLLALVRWAS